MPSVKSATGRKSDKLWRDAISIALHETVEGTKTKKLRAMAEKTVELALAGDMQAIKEIGDRMDGKPRQEVETEHSGSVAITKIEDVIVDPKDPGS